MWSHNLGSRRIIWACLPCIASLFGALVGRGVNAAHAGPKRELVHRVAKAQITPGPLLLPRAGSCPSDHSQCPGSLGGGCCRSGYECATDSCYATTAGITSACGKEGWFACPAADSGGCCPVGYICGALDCTAPAGVKDPITTCPLNYNLCPASLNYGCCQNGMGCALNACYSTSPVTATLIQTITTTTGGQAITTTQTAVTIATPSPPSGLPFTDNNVAPKFIPTSLPKISETSVPSNDGQGLTTAQVGGIVGGVVALLIVVLTASFIIIRRLNRVAEAVESKSTTQHTKSHSQAQDPYSGNHPQAYDTSGDPLMAAANHANYNGGYGTGRNRSNSDNYSSSQTPGFSPDPSVGLPSALHRPSTDSSPGYFDLPPRVHNFPSTRPGAQGAAPLRTSVDSHSTNAPHPGYAYAQVHHRQQSNASVRSDGSDAANVASPLRISELDSSGAFHELPSSTDANRRPGYYEHGRTRSNSGANSISSGVATSPPTLFNNPRWHDPTSQQTTSGALGVVNESAAETMHGYYGPRDRQVGQTAAGLGGVQWDVGLAAGGPPRPSGVVPGAVGLGPDQQRQEQQQQQGGVQSPSLPPPPSPRPGGGPSGGGGSPP